MLLSIHHPLNASIATQSLLNVINYTIYKIRGDKKKHAYSETEKTVKAMRVG